MTSSKMASRKTTTHSLGGGIGRAGTTISSGQDCFTWPRFWHVVHIFGGTLEVDSFVRQIKLDRRRHEPSPRSPCLRLPPSRSTASKDSRPSSSTDWSSEARRPIWPTPIVFWRTCRWSCDTWTWPDCDGRNTDLKPIVSTLFCNSLLSIIGGRRAPMRRFQCNAIVMQCNAIVKDNDSIKTKSFNVSINNARNKP